MKKRKRRIKRPKFKLIDYSKEVETIKEFVSRNEKLCYFFRYNAQVLTAMGKHYQASEENSKFMGLKTQLSENRYYEIMIMADNAFYEKYNF